MLSKRKSGINELPVSYPNWYHVKAEFTPEYIKIWLDTTLVFEIYDYGGITVPENKWYISSYSRSEFDNLVYTPL